MIRYRYAKIKAKDRLRTWIHHLVLNCVRPPGYPLTSMVVGVDKAWIAWEYAPVENAEDMLEKLLNKYWEGSIRPIHFFPESSWTYAELIIEKNRPSEDALRKAHEIWTGSDYKRGEVEDLYCNLCFRNIDPTDTEFQEAALEVFGPVVECQRKVEN